MGVVQKQGISNSILIFLGAAIGALNILILYPLILPKEYFGLTSILVQVTFIATQFGLLGSHLTIIKYWNTLKENNVLIKFLIKNTVLFSIVVIGILIISKPKIIESYIDKATLFTENYNYLFLLFLFGVIFEFFFAISQANLKTSLPTFLREVFIRLYQSILLILFYYKILNLNNFILAFVLGYGIIAFAALFYATIGRKLLISSDSTILTKNHKKEFYSYSIINFLAGFSGSVVVRMDVLMIGALLTNPLIDNFSLKAIAVYSIAMYVTNIIEMPYRGISTITNPIIARLWSKNNITEIGILYKKSSLNLTIISILLFTLLWANLDDLLSFIPQYQEAKWVIFILGISKVLNMCIGINNNIIQTSKYYRIGTYTMIMLILITFSLNYLLIPKYGILGAAIGSFISIAIYNFVSFVFLNYKYKLQPFSINTIKTIALGGILLACSEYISTSSETLNIIIKSLFIASTYIFSTYQLKLSSDITELINKYLKQ